MHIALSPWQTRIILLTKTFLSWTRRAYVGCLSSGSRRGYGIFLPDQRSRLELAQRNTLLRLSARENPAEEDILLLTACTFPLLHVALSAKRPEMCLEKKVLWRVAV